MFPKIILILALSLGYSIAIFAQNTANQDVLYLKNGSVIRGVLLEQSADRKVKFETYDHSIWIFEGDQIERIVKEPFKPVGWGNTTSTNANTNTTTKTIDSTAVEHPQKGFSLMANGGILFSLKEKGIVGSFEVIPGYRFNKHFCLGANLGVEFPYPFVDLNSSYYNPSTINIAFIPLMLDFMVDLPSKTSFVPFFRVDLGGAIDTDANIINGGFASQFGAGFKIKLAKKAYVNINLNYRLQTGGVKVSYDSYASFSTHFLALRVGYSF